MLDLLIGIFSRALLYALWCNVGVIVLVQLGFWLFVLVTGIASTLRAIREELQHWRRGDGWRLVQRLKESFAVGAPRIVRPR